MTGPWSRLSTLLILGPPEPFEHFAHPWPALDFGPLRTGTIYHVLPTPRSNIEWKDVGRADMEGLTPIPPFMQKRQAYASVKPNMDRDDTTATLHRQAKNLKEITFGDWYPRKLKLKKQTGSPTRTPEPIEQIISSLGCPQMFVPSGRTHLLYHHVTVHVVVFQNVKIKKQQHCPIRAKL